MARVLPVPMNVWERLFQLKLLHENIFSDAGNDVNLNRFSLHP